MKEKELIQIGYTSAAAREIALQIFNKAVKEGFSKKEAKRMLRVVIVILLLSFRIRFGVNWLASSTRKARKRFEKE
jgi:ABC-type methionine transport system permease subunit